jgi:hypothetical protein
MDHDPIFSDGVSPIRPRSTSTMLNPGAFVFCPWPLLGGSGLPDRSVADLYRLAYFQTGVMLQPPWHERNLLASWN